jgi:hypothetical protein
VTSGKVGNGSLKAGDFKEGELPDIRWARVLDEGNDSEARLNGREKAIRVSDSPDSNTYTISFTGIDPITCAAQYTPGTTEGQEGVAIAPAGATVVVATKSVVFVDPPGNQDGSFFLTLAC